MSSSHPICSPSTQSDVPVENKNMGLHLEALFHAETVLLTTSDRGVEKVNTNISLMEANSSAMLMHCMGRVHKVIRLLNGCLVLIVDSGATSHMEPQRGA
jgi:hypothetical protein